MKKLTIPMAAVALVLASAAFTAHAQTQAPGAAILHAQIKNATPIQKEINCRGWTGRMGCGPGWVWSRWAHRCVPC